MMSLTEICFGFLASLNLCNSKPLCFAQLHVVISLQNSEPSFLLGSC